MENKYITTADYNKFTKNVVDNTIKSKYFVDKSAIGPELKSEQDKIIKSQAFDSSYFRGKTHFVDDDGSQNYLVFQPM